MADEPETPVAPPEETPPEEPVAPPASPPARKARKPPAKEGGLLAPLSDADVDRVADRLMDKFREAGAFDAPLETVAAPTQPVAPPPPSEVAPTDTPAPAPPVRLSPAARFLGTG